MQLLQFIDPMYGRCVGRIDGSDVVDITSTQRDVRTIYDICYRHGGCDIGLAEAVRSIEDTGSPPRRLPVDELLSNEDPARPRIHQPIDPSPAAPTALRIWLAGVTHADSTRLREIEARQATGRPVNVYDQEIRGVRAGPAVRSCSRNTIPNQSLAPDIRSFGRSTRSDSFQKRNSSRCTGGQRRGRSSS